MSGKIQLAMCFAIVAITLASVGYAQQPKQSPPDPPDVIRVKTELIQAEVMVLDRQGRFVEGIPADQFQIQFSGERRTPSFFEEVIAGSSRERAQIAAVRSTIDDSPVLPATDHGRLIFFFLDDFHLGPESIARARTALLKFVDGEMEAGDQVAIVSATGQIGFLQQLSDHPVVLRAAIERLNSRPNGDGYPGKTQISAYAASQVLDYNDGELYAYLLESVKVEQQMGPGNRHGDHILSASMSAIPHLKNRLQIANADGRRTTASTLEAFDGLITSSAGLPGRKLVFFLSDGFVLNERGTGALEKLDRITRKANAAGVIVYTMDGRGTTMNLGSAVDASTNAYVEAQGRRAGFSSGELAATREPLNQLAKRTGGRAFFDSNSIGDAIRQSVNETSKYYLIAWRPQSDLELTGKGLARISISNHPELTVRWRNNYVPPEPKPTAADNKVTAAETLEATVKASHPNRLLPLWISAGHVHASNRELLKVSMQIERQFLDLHRPEQQDKTELDVIGVVIDDRGEASTFKQIVTVKAKPSSEEQAVTWHQELALTPGIYQIRVAVRERSTGLLGSARQWIEVPETSARFALSSLFLGERKAAPAQPAGPAPITLDVDRHFARSSILRYQTYVYNPALAGGQSDVRIQATVLSNRRQMMTVAPATVPATGDPKQLAYWSEIPLQSLKPGQYVLSVAATDRLTNTTVTQQIKFSIE